MPKFTISRDGRTLNTLQLEGERIEMGSANTCNLFIDDLLVSLHQAAFVKTPEGYDVEPLARTPVFTINGQKVDQRIKVPPGALIEVEGYEIKVEMAPEAMPDAAAGPPPTPLPPIPVKPEDQKPEPPPPLPPIPEPIPAKPEDQKPEPPPPLPPIPEPISTGKTEDQEPVTPPPLPPLPEPDTGAGRSGAEAATVYIPVRPIGQLVAIAGPLQGKEFPLTPGEVKIGRDPSQNDVVVRLDPRGEIDTSISRRHASVHVEGDSAYVEDKQSVAGTYVNERRLPPGERTPLKSGDRIEIRSAKDSTVFRVELDREPVTPTPPRVHEPPARQPAVEAYPKPPPPAAPPPPRYEPPPEPRHRPERAAEAAPAEEPRRRRRRERASVGPDNDNPFAPREDTGLPTWIWYAVGGGVVLVILIILFLFT